MVDEITLSLNINETLKALASGEIDLHEARWWIEQAFVWYC